MEQLRRCNMTEEEKQIKFDLFANMIDSTIQHCSTREDLLLLASLLMTTTHKLYSIGLVSEDKAAGLMFDYVIGKMRDESETRPEGTSLH